MSKTNVQTANRGADRFKLSLAVVVVLAGIIAYSYFEYQPTYLRVGFFVVSLIIAAFVAWTSESGKRFVGFARDSYTEVRRVHWPLRKEATQMTGIVFAFVVVMALLLWLIDKGLEWIIYGLFLGWK